MDVLHHQRFMFRTPTTKPEKYWELHPVKCPQNNKRIYLTHIGLDHVISAKTKELIHDRSDTTINIKMFSLINVMESREGSSRKSKVQHTKDGVEIESRDIWTEITSLGRIDEALDNLCRLWVVM